MIQSGIISPDRADSIAMLYATQSPGTATITEDSFILGGTMESAYGMA
jgi:hypothetical protein